MTALTPAVIAELRALAATGTVNHLEALLDAADDAAVELLPVRNKELHAALITAEQRAEQAEARVRELEAALSPILEACYLADVEGELSERIDGSLLDAARDALKGGPQ